MNFSAAFYSVATTKKKNTEQKSSNTENTESKNKTKKLKY